jgi:hypothetical protein
MAQFPFQKEDDESYTFSYADDPAPAPALAAADPYSFSYADDEPEPAPVEERTLWDETKEFLGDSVLDVANGVIQLGDSVVGLGSLLTGGMLNEGMKAIGYRPEEAQQFFSDMQSDDRKRQEKEFEAAEGWQETIKTLITEPALLGGKVAETAPMMLGIMAAAKAFAARA